MEKYDGEAIAYDRTRAALVTGRFASRERKFYRENIPKGSKVLNVACGTGRHFKYFLDELCCEHVGIDLSVKMLRIARLQEGHVELVCADAENLPFRNEIFDAVICSRAFPLFENKLSFLKEAYACLKRGGKLLVSTISKGSWIIRLGITMGLFVQNPPSYPHNSKELARMVGSVGFDNIKARCIPPGWWGFGIKSLPDFVLALIEKLEEQFFTTDGRWIMLISTRQEKPAGLPLHSPQTEIERQ